MGKFRLAFGIHNHQPVGNFTAVFEEAHQKAYEPFLRLIESYRDLRISLHQSGILWNWQKRVHPDYFELVGGLVDRGQIELLTGGFYEPILTAVPQRDAHGQVLRLTEFLNEHFGVVAEGLWLTERIWEPHLPGILSRAGVKYLPIDDTHFVYAGFEREQLTGPFVTEDEGHTVILLPIQKRLRYLIPFGTVEDVIKELRAQAERAPEGMAIYADDGEKFGVWPNTHRHCYEEGWLRRLCDAFAANADWLEVVPLGEAAAAPAVGRAYLPTASYEEMLHWALPPAAFIEYEAFEHWLQENGRKERWGRFVRGSFWRSFLAKYDEANLMHKKMLRVSEELAALEQTPAAKEPEFQAARDHLYASQCNCPYWHGVFGGLYLPHIRQAVYSHMISAHLLARRLAGRSTAIEQVDYDCDGNGEIVFDSDAFTAVLKPDRGGTLLELSLNRHAFNLTDTLTRRREGYHLKLDRAVAHDRNEGHASIHDLVLAKEEGLKELLVEDWYLKRCFIDHFFSAGVDLASFEKGEFGEDGDFVLEPYAAAIQPGQHRVRLQRHGHVRRRDGVFPVTVVKEFEFADFEESLRVTYRLSSSAPNGVEVDFAVENNFNFQAGHAVDRFVLVDGRRPEDSFLDGVGSHSEAHAAVLADEYRSLAVAVSADRPAEIWRLPILTVSLSEGGFEKVYQGTTLVHRFALRLTEQPTAIEFTLAAGALAKVLDRFQDRAGIAR